MLNIKHVNKFACDIDSSVRKFIKGNFQHTRLHTDVHSSAFQNEETVDVFGAGFPCQPFSAEGSRAPSLSSLTSTLKHRRNIVKVPMSFAESKVLALQMEGQILSSLF